MKVRAFITHKQKESYKDCQDRFSVNPDTKSVAVSDGMSSSIFQTIWAELLVTSYTQCCDWNPVDNYIKDLASVWYEKAEESANNNPSESGKRRGRNSLKLGKSAGATFVGIRIDKNSLDGVVLGDSCLLYISSDNKIKKICTSQKGEFNNFPDYFDSNPNKIREGDLIDIKIEHIEENEKIIMVSDPFSDFLYVKRKEEKEMQYIEKLLKIRTHGEFCSLVERWREEGMHNDDSTLIIMEDWQTEEWDINCDNIDSLIDNQKGTVPPTLTAENQDEENQNEENQKSNENKISLYEEVQKLIKSSFKDFSFNKQRKLNKKIECGKIEKFIKTLLEIIKSHETTTNNN